ncbi:hatching enzyme 1.2-like [Lethenteron reissneri]|nr:hatching enzyme 1.2-like [Lethenteron reissneri]XP_061433543.1 hatching enzyme 1.2-like [Lethenteron reissneri]
MHVFGFHRDQQNGSHDWVKHRDGKVYILYDVCSGFDTNDKENIQHAVNEFAEKTCVRLIRKDNQEDYINFQALDGSWSFLGKKGGAQSLSLEPRKVTKGIVLHELMHTLGFHHEHCRSDRDQHIKVHEDNVKEDELGQFKRLECSGCREYLPYDYLSIMHYGRYASSSDYMSETITPTTTARAPIGQRSGLSPLDVLRVQRKYQPILAGVSEDKALKVALAKTAALCETLQEPPRPTQDLAVQAEMIEQMLTHHWQGLQLEQMEAMKK